MLLHCIIPTALLALATTVCSHDDVAPTPSFGYSLESGPVTWAGLRPAGEWDACRLGQHQSPIVVYTRDAMPVPRGSFNLSLSNTRAGVAQLENLGTTLEVPAERTTDGALRGLLVFDGTAYVLQQLHFHTPSEHRVNDEHFPLEMHLVFSTAVRAPHSNTMCLTPARRRASWRSLACSSSCRTGARPRAASCATSSSTCATRRARGRTRLPVRWTCARSCAPSPPARCTRTAAR